MRHSRGRDTLIEQSLNDKYIAVIAGMSMMLIIVTIQILTIPMITGRIK